MPKPLKKKTASQRPARPRDVNQWARHMVEQSTTEPEPDTKTQPAIAPAALSAYMAALGSKGGKIGGKRRLETMTKKARIAVAKKAATTRWKDHK